MSIENSMDTIQKVNANASPSDSQIRHRQMSPESEERLLAGHKKNLVRDRVIKHIGGTKLNQVIAYLLQQFYKSSKSNSS
jgi:hypothetical protein